PPRGVAGGPPSPVRQPYHCAPGRDRRLRSAGPGLRLLPAQSLRLLSAGPRLRAAKAGPTVGIAGCGGPRRLGAMPSPARRQPPRPGLAAARLEHGETGSVDAPLITRARVGSERSRGSMGFPGYLTVECVFYADRAHLNQRSSPSAGFCPFDIPTPLCPSK